MCWTYTVAACEGQLKVLQWLGSQGCPRNVRQCAYAAGGGHLEVLQWARSQGGPWDRETCASAARGGHLEVLQWARSQVCPRNEWTAQMQLVEAIWKCCNGPEANVLFGIRQVW